MKKILVMTSVMMLGAMSLQATGTAANTDINNSVTLSYDVNNVAQTQVPSNTDTFKVDRKIDLIVDATNTPLDVTPSATDQNLSFVVRNDGNDADTFTLTVTDNIGGDDFNPTGCDITDTSGNSINSVALAADANVTVYVTCDIPAAGNPHVVDDDNGTISLLATSSYSNDSSSDDPAVVQNVWVDGAGTDDNNLSGSFSDRGTYHVVSADLTATKTSCVFWDPVNLNTNPKRIPGAKIRYAIQVTNNGSADADNVETTDTLKGELTYSNAYIREGNCACGSPSGNANEGDASTTGNSNSHDVTLNFETVEASSSECAYIEATIN